MSSTVIKSSSLLTDHLRKHPLCLFLALVTDHLRKHPLCLFLALLTDHLRKHPLCLFLALVTDHLRKHPLCLFLALLTDHLRKHPLCLFLALLTDHLRKHPLCLFLAYLSYFMYSSQSRSVETFASASTTNITLLVVLCLLSAAGEVVPHGVVHCEVVADPTFSSPLATEFLLNISSSSQKSLSCSLTVQIC